MWVQAMETAYCKVQDKVTHIRPLFGPALPQTPRIVGRSVHEAALYVYLLAKSQCTPHVLWKR